MSSNVSHNGVGTMRAVTLHGWGAPDVLRLERVDAPEPGPGEFRVRVSACGVCGHDVLARAGELSAAGDAVLGHEIAGVVDLVGSEDLAHWKGRRVALTQRRVCGVCPDCLRGAGNQCRVGPGFYGDDIPGGYAEYVLADPGNAVELPDSVPDGAGAILSCGVGTGYRALEASGCAPGDVVLVTGAAGGVGLNAVALAASRSLRVIGAVSDEAKAAAVREAGAEEALVRPDRAAVREASIRLGRPRGVDAVLELTGSPSFELGYRSLRPGGALVLVGNVAAARSVELPVGLTILRELRVIGSAHATRADLEEVVRLVASGALALPRTTAYPLAEAAEAHGRLEERTQMGRAVLVP